jgi:hypothetical protein
MDSSRIDSRCEHEATDLWYPRCEAPYRFVVARADGDKTYSGGEEDGVYRVCPTHLADAVMDMAGGDDVALTVTIRYDDGSDREALTELLRQFAREREYRLPEMVDRILGVIEGAR